MAETKIKIRLFSVTKGAEELPTLLQKVQGMDDVADRNRQSPRGGFVRMHHIHQEDNGLWLMHFIRSRHGHGSIKVSEEGIEKVTYGKKQKPGEDIAALYAPDTRHLLVQENGHFRMTPVRDYLNQMQEKPVFDMEAVPADLDKFNPDRLSMLHFKLEPQWFSSQGIREGKSMKRVLATGYGDEALRVEIKISTTKRGDILPPEVREVAEALAGHLKRQKSHEQESKDVSKLSVGVLNPDNKADILNLRNPLVEVEIPMNLDSGWVFPLDERYKALLSQHKEWERLLKIMRQS